MKIQECTTHAPIFKIQAFDTESEGREYRSVATLRFDDQCGNGHQTFSITGRISERRAGSRTAPWQVSSSGCVHEDIARRFPQYAHLIKWHGTTTAGPLYYVENTTYNAGNLDSRGKLEGEPWAWDDHAQFDDFAITYPLKEGLKEWLAAYTKGDPVVVREVRSLDGKYSGFTFGDQKQWSDCPFRTVVRAEQFAQAVREATHIQVLRIPTLFSEGKARELDSARRCAVWPDATDHQLCAPKGELTAALEARRPALLVAFRADMEAAGFGWRVKA